MNLITDKNKTLAFQRFFSQIKFQKIYPEQLRSFGISEKLIETAAELRDRPTRNFTAEEKQIYRNVRLMFETLWKKYENDLNLTARWLRAYRKDLAQIVHLIEKSTKIRWPYTKVFIFPGIRNWGGSFKNQVCIGVKPQNMIVPPDDTHLWYGTTTLIIHELIHVNTSKIDSRNRDAEEIATILMTRRVSRAYNRKFRANIPDQKLARPFKNLEKYESVFEKFLSRSNSYPELLKRIDKFLAARKHKARYTV